MKNQEHPNDTDEESVIDNSWFENDLAASLDSDTDSIDSAEEEASVEHESECECEHEREHEREFCFCCCYQLIGEIHQCLVL